MSETVKPVPCFCGREPVSAFGEALSSVFCDYCGLERGAATADKAIARWNALLEPVTRMREALEEIAECGCNCDGPKTASHANIDKRYRRGEKKRDGK